MYVYVYVAGAIGFSWKEVAHEKADRTHDPSHVVPPHVSCPMIEKGWSYELGERIQDPSYGDHLVVWAKWSAVVGYDIGDAYGMHGMHILKDD